MFPVDNMLRLSHIPLSPPGRPHLTATSCLNPFAAVEADALIARFALSGRDTAAATLIILPFFTMMFLHGGWLHLILNMWRSGVRRARRRPVRVQRAIFLLRRAVIAALTRLPVQLTSANCAGHSASYRLLCAAASLSRLIVVIPHPSFVLLRCSAIVRWNLVPGRSSRRGWANSSRRPVPGIAWWAHVGGFLAGRVPEKSAGRQSASIDGDDADWRGCPLLDPMGRAAVRQEHKHVRRKDTFWFFFMFTAQPVLCQRMLEAMRTRKIGAIGEEAKFQGDTPRARRRTDAVPGIPVRALHRHQ